LISYCHLHSPEGMIDVYGANNDDTLEVHVGFGAPLFHIFYDGTTHNHYTSYQRMSNYVNIHNDAYRINQ
jgi:hypothetical protein